MQTVQYIEVQAGEVSNVWSLDEQHQYHQGSLLEMSIFRP